jgi:hypothetical protein
MIFPDRYSLTAETMGIESAYKTGLRIVTADGAPIRDAITEQYDPMEFKRWSYDTFCGAMRMYIQNDCAPGLNIYEQANILIFLGTTPQIRMYVDTTTCNLSVTACGVLLREWGVHSTPWTQVNSGTDSRRGISFGPGGQWLMGFIANKEFGLFGRKSAFDSWSTGDSYGDVWANLTAIDATGALQDEDYCGAGGLFFGASNQYRFGVDRTGRLCLWQISETTKQYALIEQF